MPLGSYATTFSSKSDAIIQRGRQPNAPALTRRVQTSDVRTRYDDSHWSCGAAYHRLKTRAVPLLGHCAARASLPPAACCKPPIRGQHAEQQIDLTRPEELAGEGYQRGYDAVRNLIREPIRESAGPSA